MRTRSVATRPRSSVAATCQASTAATTPHTPSASSIPAARSDAARGAREEDHAFRIARHLVEAPDELRLPPAIRRDDGHRRPHPELQLLAERLDQVQLLGGDLDIALGDQD